MPPDDIRFFCPACRAKLAIDGSVAGFRVTCPECGSSIAVPRASDPGRYAGARPDTLAGRELTAEEIQYLTGEPAPVDRGE